MCTERERETRGEKVKIILIYPQQFLRTLTAIHSASKAFTMRDPTQVLIIPHLFLLLSHLLTLYFFPLLSLGMQIRRESPNEV